MMMSKDKNEEIRGYIEGVRKEGSSDSSIAGLAVSGPLSGYFRLVFAKNEQANLRS
jgi:hypothetical protein